MTTGDSMGRCGQSSYFSREKNSNQRICSLCAYAAADPHPFLPVHHYPDLRAVRFFQFFFHCHSNRRHRNAGAEAPSRTGKTGIMCNDCKYSCLFYDSLRGGYLYLNPQIPVEFCIVKFDRHSGHLLTGERETIQVGD